MEKDDSYELASSVQKCVRRNLEKEAMHFALRMIPRDERFLWIRLLTVANEDVGIANPIVLAVVPALERSYFYLRSMKRDGSARLVLANAISLLCRSPKSRHADFLQCVTSDDLARGVKLPIPDFAIDRHTKAGKRRGRGVEHWLKEGCRLEPAPDKAFTLYQQEAEERWLRGVEKLDWSGKANDSGNLFESKGESNDSSNEEGS